MLLVDQVRDTDWFPQCISCSCLGQLTRSRLGPPQGPLGGSLGIRALTFSTQIYSNTFNFKNTLIYAIMRQGNCFERDGRSWTFDLKTLPNFRHYI